jgi:hypothetical protein
MLLNIFCVISLLFLFLLGVFGHLTICYVSLELASTRAVSPCYFLSSDRNSVCWLMLDIDLCPLLGAHEVSVDVMVAGHSNTCCCLVTELNSDCCCCSNCSSVFSKISRVEYLFFLFFLFFLSAEWFSITLIFWLSPSSVQVDLNCEYGEFFHIDENLSTRDLHRNMYTLMC